MSSFGVLGSSKPSVADIADVLAAAPSGDPSLARVQSLVSGYVVKGNNVGVVVSPLTVAGFAAAGGSIAMPGAGTWYVGVELSSGVLRVLPRLGHRGWIPVARVVCTASAITSLQQIAPALPVCRLPRTMRKVLSGNPISVVVMGSSLTASDGGATTWPGMVFGAGTTDKYKLPVTVACQYRGVGGAPSGYQAAQLGFATGNSNYGFTNTGYSFASTDKAPPNGRSKMFNGVDVVVIGCLANGGDYRMELIEPIIRQLRKRGVEVIVVTDNPQNPSTDYAAMTSAPLHSDGSELMRIADLYGVEIADTSGYVFEAYIRAAGIGIYGDATHMVSGAPSGPAALLPANGHEAWARSVRSVFPVLCESSTQVTTNTWDFASSSAGWGAYGAAVSTSMSGGKLVSTTTAPGNGIMLTLAGAVVAGDTVTVTYDSVISGITLLQIGTQWSGGWSSNVVSAALNGTATVAVLTITQPFSALQLLFYASAGTGTFSLDNVTVAVQRAAPPIITDMCPGRPGESRQLPPVRIVTDMRTPGDMCVTLPSDERHLRVGHTAAGVLGAHPWGSGSFARQFSASVGAAQDLLTLTVGKKAVLSADCVVGMSIIHQRDVADGPCVFNVNMDGSLRKTMTIATVPFSNEWHLTIYTPTELNATSPAGGFGSIEIEVTTGTLKLCALVASTADIDYLSPEQITYAGTGWGAKEASRSGLPGRWTDTLGDAAFASCPGMRLYWILSANPGSKPVTYISPQEQAVSQAVAGNYNILSAGGLRAAGNHVVKCAEANAAGSQANGHALHIGGAIIVNDR